MDVVPGARPVGCRQLLDQSLEGRVRRKVRRGERREQLPDARLGVPLGEHLLARLLVDRVLIAEEITDEARQVLEGPDLRLAQENDLAQVGVIRRVGP